MRTALACAGLVFGAFARAQDEAPVRASAFGEGGGYEHPDAEAGHFLENSPRLNPGAPPPDASPAPRRAPPPAAPSTGPRAPASAAIPRSLPAAPSAGAASPRPGGASSSPSAAPAPRLWNGLVKPLEMPASKAAEADPERAAEAGGRDYEARLGAAVSGPARPRLGGAPAAPRPGADAPREPSAPPPGLLVSIDFDPDSGPVRDAVAGLGAVGFVSAPHLAAAAGAGPGRLVGWLPSSRLGEAATRPGVRRVFVERGDPRAAASPAPRAASRGEFIIGLRVSDPERAAASVEASLRALASSAGLENTSVLGLETAPDGRPVAVVSGTLPIANLSQVLDRPEVLIVRPRAAAGAPEPAPVPAPRPEWSASRLAASRGLRLALLTLAATAAALLALRKRPKAAPAARR